MAYVFGQQVEHGFAAPFVLARHDRAFGFVEPPQTQGRFLADAFAVDHDDIVRFDRERG